MSKRTTVLALSLCFLLTACGGPREDRRGQASLLEEASGLPDDRVILTVDGREIPAWRYLYWLSRACDIIYEQYERAGMELDWDASADGNSVAAYIKEQALADTVLYATVENWADTYHCAAPQEEVPPSGGVPVEGLLSEQIVELNSVGFLYGELNRCCREAEIPLSPNAAELEDFADRTGRITLDRILIPAGEDREAARHKAEETFARLNNAADQQAVFLTLAETGGDSAGPRTVVLGEGTLDETLEQAAVSLSEGQFSGILETGEGFSILQRLPPDRETLMDDYFDDLLQRTAEQALICQTQEYAELDVKEFYTSLQKARETQKDT